MNPYRKALAGRYGTHPVNLVLTPPTLTQNTTTRAFVAIPAKSYVSRVYLLNPGTATTAGTASYNIDKYVDGGAGDINVATVDPELAVSQVPRAFTINPAASDGNRTIQQGGVLVIRAVADNSAVANIAGMQVVVELMVAD
jgi:hypothetical protein